MSLGTSEQEVQCRDPKKYEFIQRTVDFQLYRTLDEDRAFVIVDLITNDELKFNEEDSYEIVNLLQRADDITEFERKTGREI
jgi:hypothetical protein